MTLPALVQKYEDKVTVTKVKKAYSIFSQAYARAIEANGGLPKEEWDCSNFTSTSDGSMRPRCYMSYMLPYMNNIRSCYVDKHESTKCTFSSFRLENNDTWIYSLKGESMGRLSNNGGAYTVGSDGIEFMIHQNYIYIKTDRKLKNVFNKNVFPFYLGKDKLSFGYSTPRDIESYWKSSNASSGVSWILLHGNLDYMRCPDKVGINGPYSCK